MLKNRLTALVAIVLLAGVAAAILLHKTEKTAGNLDEKKLSQTTESQEKAPVHNTSVKKQPEVETTPAEAPASEKADPAQQPAEKQPAPAAETSKTNVYFASREEAIQFGMSRFTAEEIALYNQVAANGMTPEQEAMALSHISASRLKK